MDGFVWITQPKCLDCHPSSPFAPGGAAHHSGALARICQSLLTTRVLVAGVLFELWSRPVFVPALPPVREGPGEGVGFRANNKTPKGQRTEINNVLSSTER